MEDVRKRLLSMATKRASKWMTFQSIEEAKPMPTQVGGVSLNRTKRSVLTLAPEYALKPLHIDDRGFREVHFYEALKLANKGGAMEEMEDVVSTWLGVFDWKGLSSDDLAKIRSVASWRKMKKEIDMLRKLSNFTPDYYGVIGQTAAHHAISPSSYLLLTDITVNFVKPCVLDLKMGRKSHEPDAPPDKVAKEIAKYSRQDTFGFRIVGMRAYDPSHPQANPQGFRTFDKNYGRKLHSKPHLLQAFRTFFQQAHVPNAHMRIHQILSEREGTVSQYDVANLTQKLLANKGVLRSKVITNLLHQLQGIRRWFEDNRLMSFCSSSILIVIEGDVASNNHDRAILKMIDFGHLRRDANGDPGYLYGIRTVLKIFSFLLAEAEKQAAQISQQNSFDLVTQAKTN